MFAEKSREVTADHAVLDCSRSDDSSNMDAANVTPTTAPSAGRSLLARLT
jgi:hypothetical protein